MIVIPFVLLQLSLAAGEDPATVVRSATFKSSLDPQDPNRKFTHSSVIKINF